MAPLVQMTTTQRLGAANRPHHSQPGELTPEESHLVEVGGKGALLQTQRAHPGEGSCTVPHGEGSCSIRRVGVGKGWIEKTRINSAASGILEGSPGALGRRVVTFEFDAGRQPITDVRLSGSWDGEGNPASQWPPFELRMEPQGDGRWIASIQLEDTGNLPRFEWGVIGNLPHAHDQWLVMGEDNLQFDLNATTPVQRYAPTDFHRMGAQVRGDDLAFAYWAPRARSVTVEIQLPGGPAEFPMVREADGTWVTSAPSLAAAAAAGHPYTYRVVTSEGETVTRTDPYARAMQGEQRGLSRIFVHPTTGQEATFFSKDRDELMRFEVNHGANFDRVELIIKDPSGRPLNRDQLKSKLGGYDPEIISHLRGGEFNDLWTQHVSPIGRIALVNVGGGWSTLVNNVAALQGLRYEFVTYRRDNNGTLNQVGSSHVKDPWSDTITESSGKSFRAGLVPQASYVRQHDNAPRENDPAKWIIYQAHVGSFAGGPQNIRRSTLQDLTQELDYIQELGVNTIELLPVGEFEGIRNWGYYASNVFAVESAYGYHDEETDRWVHGPEALARFVDEAHRRGINVLNDVVYNHAWGEYDPLHEHDGPHNTYYNWSSDPQKVERRVTPWGPMPSFKNSRVEGYFADHAIAQVLEYGFDGLRFDFTSPIKDMGEHWGWNFLRKVNRQLNLFKPGTFTVAEQFDYDPAMTTPVDQGGAGFDAQWYTEVQHQLVYDHDPNRPGLLQQVTQGRRTNVDKFMATLLGPRGLTAWKDALFVISNHDEVGNAHRTIEVAQGKEPSEPPSQRARSLARWVAGIGAAAPGIPIMFQGDEFYASNGFRWGITSTWGMDWTWRDVGPTWNWNAIEFNDAIRELYDQLAALPERERLADPQFLSLSAENQVVCSHYAAAALEDRDTLAANIGRRQMHQFVQEVFSLRNATEELCADAPVKRVYTHNDDSVFAFSRHQGDKETLVIANLSAEQRPNYTMPIPAGTWRLRINSDSARYGGAGIHVPEDLHSDGTAEINLPAGSVLFLERIQTDKARETGPTETDLSPEP